MSNYNVKTIARAAVPRSKRLREGAAPEGTQSTGGSTVGGHSHTNKEDLDRIRIDGQYIKVYTDAEQGEEPIKELVNAKAGFADNAKRWDGMDAVDYLDQPVKTSSSVTFEALMVSGQRIYFGDVDHYIEIDVDGNFHFSHNVWSEGNLSAGGLSSGGGGGGGSIVSWNQLATGGTKIATISIDGVSTDVYAPATATWENISGKPSWIGDSKPSYAFSEITGTASASQIPSLSASKITSGTFADERIASASTWNAKYSKPSGGIPKTDLESTVQDSLGLADGALQRSKFNVAQRQSGSSLATCDDLIGTCGIFRMGSKSDSVTPDTGGYGQLLSMFGGGDTYAQIYLGYYNDANRNIYFRSGTLTGTGGHKTWHHVYHDGNLTSLSQLAQDTTHRLVTDTQTAAWNEVASLFTKESYTENGVTKYRIKANFGLYSDGFISAGGIGTGGGGGTDVSWTNHDSNYGTLTIAGTGHNVSLYGHTHSQYMLANLKGVANGVAELDSAGKIPTSQLPSYVSDVIEKNTKSQFPATGEANTIYIAKDTNLTYRWTGSAYVEISPSIALGETSATAYRGDRGKTAYDHSQITSGNPHGVSFANIGGSLAASQVPELAAAKITSGTFDSARIPNLAATKITSGTFDTARIPTLAISKISGLQSALDGKLSLTGGTMTGSIVYEGDGNIVPLYRNITRTIDGGWSRHIAQLRVDGSSKFSISAFGNYTVGASGNGITYAYLGCNTYNGLNLRITADSLKWGADDIYHAGNANKTSVAWKASSLTLAGAISGATTGAFSGKVTANEGLNVTIDDISLAAVSTTTGVLMLGRGTTDNGKSTYVYGNVLRFRTGASRSDAMAITADGKVGIGISNTSPEASLSVLSSDTYPVVIKRSSATAVGYIQFQNTGTYPKIGAFGIYGSSSLTEFRWLAYSKDTSQTSSALAHLSMTGNFTAEGQVTTGAASDIRFKRNVESMKKADVESILAGLRPVEFDWNELGTELSGNKGHDTGLIAQEVCSVFPYAVSPIYERYLRVDYAKLTPILVAGWQSHEMRIANLERENEMLKEEIKRLRS